MVVLNTEGSQRQFTKKRSDRLDKRTFLQTFLTQMFNALHECRAKTEPGTFDEISLQIWNFVSAECDSMREAMATVVQASQHVKEFDPFQGMVGTANQQRNFINTNVPIPVRNYFKRYRIARYVYKEHFNPFFVDPYETIAEKDPRSNDPLYGAFVNLPHKREELVYLLADELLRFNKSRLDKASDVADDLNDKASIVFVSHLFPTTWDPFVRALKARGRHTAWIGPKEVNEFDSYGVIETRNLSTDVSEALGFLGTLACLCQAKTFEILLSGECFYGSNWRVNDTTVLYMIMSIVTKTIKSIIGERRNLNLIMYDGLKPVADEDLGNRAIADFYRTYMQQADRIVYNSNVEMFGEFIEFAFNIHAPRLHFYRYSAAPTRMKRRINHKKKKNIHIACITVVLAEFGEPSRDSVPYYVKKIIESGIHFHYYCNVSSPVVKSFQDLLGPYAEFFHPHPINKDQAALVSELHQYHAGFNPSDHVPFAHGIVGLHDRRYQDGMSMFWQSTVGTSFLVYAAAGLPFFLPRGCVGSTQLLKEAALPINLSEMEDLPAYFKKLDLDAKLEAADAARSKATMDHHIGRFTRFLKSS